MKYTMIYDLQKGSLLKRASAFLLDGILLVILATGFIFALSGIFNYNKYSDAYSDGMDYYAAKFDINFEDVVSQADYDALPEAERARYDEAITEMNNDAQLVHYLNTLVSMIVAMVSLGIFLAFAIIEYLFPMIFKNGQTVGKKVFGLGVMRTSGVRLGPVALFIRTFFGKYVIETMIPVLIALMLIFNAMGIMGSTGIMGPIFVFGLLILQIAMVAVTKTNSMLHDKISDCVVVDLASQMIFDDEQAMINYKTNAAAENAQKSVY